MKFTSKYKYKETETTRR